MLGLSLPVFTTLHVIISLIAVGTGFLVIGGFFGSRTLPMWTQIFIAMTALTDITGFMFPSEKLLPSHVVGILSLLVLLPTLLGRYLFRLSGKWRGIYVVCSVVSLYFNVFVLVVQSFLKVPALHALAPKGNEPPFAMAQLAVLGGFVVLGFFAVRRFHPR